MTHGTFAIGTKHSTGPRSHPYAVAIADFDNDNTSDIAVANSGTNNVLILYVFGNETFGKEESYPLGYGYRPNSVAVTDLNQDGTDNVEILMKMC